MADFTLIERHKAATVTIIVVGGLIVYLWWRNRSAAQAAANSQIAGADGVVYSGQDPNQLAADVALTQQQQQIQGQVSLATIQGQTAITGAQIAAGVQTQQITSQQEVTDAQTSAQLKLGLAQLGEQVQLAGISAGVQESYLSAIIAALGGRTSAGSTTPNGSNVDTNINPNTPVAVAPVVTPVYSGTNAGGGTPTSAPPPAYTGYGLTTDPGTVAAPPGECQVNSCPGPYSNAQENYDVWLQQNQAWGRDSGSTMPTGTITVPVSTIPPAGYTAQPGTAPYVGQ